MGEKREVKVAQVPGPGEYDHENATKLQTRDRQVIIGTEERNINIARKQKDIPGPGTYTSTYTEFGAKTRGGFIGKASRDDDWEYVTEEQYQEMTKSSARRTRAER